MKTFEPTLTLSQEPDGQYSLRALTMAPSSSYWAERPKVGAPPDVSLLPKVLPVLLPVRRREEVCDDVLTPLMFRLRDLQIGDARGKTSVLAFVMLDGEVVGSASVRLEEARTGVELEQRRSMSSDWYAWINRMPPGPASFHVVGQVAVEDMSVRLRLVRAEPQGIHPAELILDLERSVDYATPYEAQTVLKVRYDEPQAAIAYKGVLVRIPGTDGVHIGVEEVF